MLPLAPVMVMRLMVFLGKGRRCPPGRQSLMTALVMGLSALVICMSSFTASATLPVRSRFPT
jgi:hypothetical protein